MRSGSPPLAATDERDAPPVASADEMSELLHLNQTGHSAAFFDLDRTLISGSSAFVFGVSAWRADMLPSKQFARDAVSAIVFKLRGDKGGDVVAKIRERILGAVTGLSQDSLVGLNETIVPKLLERVRPESKQLLDLHRRQGRATYIISASPKELVEPLAMALGMTDGIGTVSRDRRRALHGRARRPVLLRRRQGRGDRRDREVGGLRPPPVLRVLGFDQRPTDARSRRSPRRREPGRTAEPDRAPTWMADRDLRPAHEARHPSHDRRRRHGCARRRVVQRRLAALRSPPLPRRMSATLRR